VIVEKHRYLRSGSWQTISSALENVPALEELYLSGDGCLCLGHSLQPPDREEDGNMMFNKSLLRLVSLNIEERCRVCTIRFAKAVLVSALFLRHLKIGFGQTSGLADWKQPTTGKHPCASEECTESDTVRLISHHCDSISKLILLLKERLEALLTDFQYLRKVDCTIRV